MERSTAEYFTQDQLLPMEMWQHVFTFLPPEDLARIRVVDRVWKTLVDSQQFWSAWLKGRSEASAIPIEGLSIATRVALVLPPTDPEHRADVKILEQLSQTRSELATRCQLAGRVLLMSGLVTGSIYLAQLAVGKALGKLVPSWGKVPTSVVKPPPPNWLQYHHYHHYGSANEQAAAVAIALLIALISVRWQISAILVFTDLTTVGVIGLLVFAGPSLWEKTERVPFSQPAAGECITPSIVVGFALLLPLISEIRAGFWRHPSLWKWTDHSIALWPPLFLCTGTLLITGVDLVCGRLKTAEPYGQHGTLKINDERLRAYSRWGKIDGKTAGLARVLLAAHKEVEEKLNGQAKRRAKAQLQKIWAAHLTPSSAPTKDDASDEV